jgi:hypothetical protein
MVSQPTLDLRRRQRFCRSVTLYARALKKGKAPQASGRQKKAPH